MNATPHRSYPDLAATHYSAKRRASFSAYATGSRTSASHVRRAVAHDELSVFESGSCLRPNRRQRPGDVLPHERFLVR